MNAQKVKNREGFTIIEVVLVLAIAALIFLMVFIALPALQRNQRDTARKTVLGKVASAVTSYQSNHRGTQPASGSTLNGYLDGTVSGSDTKIESDEYTVKVNPRGTGALADGGTGSASTTIVQVVTAAKCNSANQIAQGTSRAAAVIIQLENGNDYICQEV